ncbi:hypothetical protein GOBAR_AA30378 [Gossypium barbadense]|uniref:Reverse transcriptase zinc-binding domain-containing protein n=1 Tax=Gossypium barbadense TaxID=3634 RepID=A0A2P5WGY1_GOSBA|nr:hypothetical protein GOBAR_AA30378 [Gossypium barbadense]
MHLVRWETVTLPKAERGIDTPAKPKNQALLVKLGWQFIHEKDNLWAKTLVAKKVSLLLEAGMRWVVRDGTIVNFWNDNWSGLGP